MSLGSCLVTNEPSGMAEAFIQARIDGKSWAQIAEEFDLPNPGAARKAFQKATGISDFKIKGQALKDLVQQGPNALKAVNEAKAAAKKVKALDDVIAKPDIDLPQPKGIKAKLNQSHGYTDDDFDKMFELWKQGKALPDITDVYPMSSSDIKALNKLWHEENNAAKLAAQKKAEKEFADLDLNFTELEKAKLDLQDSILNDAGFPISYDEAVSTVEDIVNWVQQGKSSAWIHDMTGVLESDIDKIKLASKYDNLKEAVKHVDEMSVEIKKQLYDDLNKFANDQEFALQVERNKAKQAVYDYLDKYEGTPQYDPAVLEKLKAKHKLAVNNYNEFMDGAYKDLQKSIDKVLDSVSKTPVNVPNIPVNQPVKQTTVSQSEIAKKTGLTQEQVEKIVEMNKNGSYYSDIKSAIPGIDFKQIDEVVWNDLLTKHNGFTWRAYTEKPTSESGFNAVKQKVFEARSKGLTIDEIVGKPGAPPKTVVQAIIDDKWKLPSPGTKVPHIPPPPPPPPQVFGGTIPSSTGVNFRRHGNQEMLDWITPDTAGLPSAQRSAITSYTNSGYHDINSYLRGSGLTDTQGYGYSGSNITKTIENLDATMRPLPVDTIVTRNFTGVQHLPAEPQDMVGLVYHDNAFMSTTVKEAGVFSGDVQLIIHCPQGTMSRYVNDISVHKSEEELLLARGTKMVVTKVEKHGDGYSTRWRLFCEVIAG